MNLEEIQKWNREKIGKGTLAHVLDALIKMYKTKDYYDEYTDYAFYCDCILKITDDPNWVDADGIFFDFEHAIEWSLLSKNCNEMFLEDQKIETQEAIAKLLGYKENI